MLHLCSNGAVQEEEGKKKRKDGAGVTEGLDFQILFHFSLLFPDLDELGLKSLSLFVYFCFIKLIRNFRIKQGQKHIVLEC